MSVDIKRIAILGTGSMGGAILSGLLKSGFDPNQISVSTKSTDSAERLAEELGVLSFALENGDDANQMAVAGADVVLIGVKPAYVLEVLADVADSLNDNALVISVAAGTTTASMEAVLPEDVGVVRAMPNTPAIVGRAVTGVAAGERATDWAVDVTRELFETVGKVLVLDESKIDALSTISGSGPAYVFYLIEQMTKAAKHQGFSDEDAALLVNETFLGAAELLVDSGKAPDALRKQVTSPNGTTERAIARMEQTDLAAMFAEATDAALARAREIAAGK
ncbi:pyrroline-5-carboxylate reductase [Rhodoluna limnophila]|uniref:pyrroline-5-carboxylate reductase n=1 Tax=Rhodoluna limnophila TaxID=232537 RepID=UPI003CCC5A2C